jgi:uncharacterized membrane protein
MESPKFLEGNVGFDCGLCIGCIVCFPLSLLACAAAGVGLWMISN